MVNLINVKVFCRNLPKIVYVHNMTRNCTSKYSDQIKFLFFTIDLNDVSSTFPFQTRREVILRPLFNIQLPVLPSLHELAVNRLTGNTIFVYW